MASVDKQRKLAAAIVIANEWKCLKKQKKKATRPVGRGESVIQEKRRDKTERELKERLEQGEGGRARI